MTSFDYAVLGADLRMALACGHSDGPDARVFRTDSARRSNRFRLATPGVFSAVKHPVGWEATMRNGPRNDMRISNAVHEAAGVANRVGLQGGRRALPVHGGAEDFQTLLELMVSLDPPNSESLPTRALWRARDRLGAWFDLGRVSVPIHRGRADAGGKLPIPGTTETSLIVRLPAGLSNTAADLIFDSMPFAPLYRTDDEFAAELSNRTITLNCT